MLHKLHWPSIICILRKSSIASIYFYDFNKFFLFITFFTIKSLKAENILINADGYIKLSDFGLSSLDAFEEKAFHICGTLDYLAPEMLEKKGYDYRIDWWTLGCVLYEMVFCEPPFA